MTGEISGIPSTLGDPMSVTIEALNEVGSEEISLTLVVKRFPIWVIVLMSIGGVILFCLIVLVLARYMLIRRNMNGIPKKSLERQHTLI